MNTKIGDALSVLLPVGVFLSIAIYFASMLYHTQKSDIECRQMGHTDSVTTMLFETYCTNAYAIPDEYVPIEEARENFELHIETEDGAGRIKYVPLEDMI